MAREVAKPNIRQLLLFVCRGHSFGGRCSTHTGICVQMCFICITGVISTEPKRAREYEPGEKAAFLDMEQYANTFTVDEAVTQWFQTRIEECKSSTQD